MTPYYNKCTQKGLIRHFTAIADSVDIPLILYNVPSRTGVNIQLPTYVELAKHPRIAAVKEASGDLSAIIRIRQACGDALTIYSATTTRLCRSCPSASGVISVLSNVAPRTAHDICQLYFDGKVKGIRRTADCFHGSLISALFSEVNPIPVKAAMNFLGYAAGSLRLHLLTELEPEHQAALKAVMKKHGLLK